MKSMYDSAKLYLAVEPNAKNVSGEFKFEDFFHWYSERFMLSHSLEGQITSEDPVGFLFKEYTAEGRKRILRAFEHLSLIEAPQTL